MENDDWPQKDSQSSFIQHDNDLMNTTNKMATEN